MSKVDPSAQSELVSLVIQIPGDILQRIDATRGEVSRSTYIATLLGQHFRSSTTKGTVVVDALVALMMDRQEWTGTPSALLDALEREANALPPLRSTVASKDWPKAPHILSRRLNELKSHLSTLGLQIEYDRRGPKGERQVLLTWKGGRPGR